MMTAEQYASIMQALALLARENAGLKERRAERTSG